MKCVCPNDLKNLLTVERVSPSATVDGSGNVDESLDANWVYYGEVWAKCATRGSREFVSGPQVREDISHQWTVRWTPTTAQYKTGMRLRLDGRKFNIAAPPRNLDEDNDWIVIDTVETATV